MAMRSQALPCMRPGFICRVDPRGNASEPSATQEGRMNEQDSSIMLSGAAILAGIGILPPNAQPLARDGFVDRELILSVSDGFTRQTWVQDGRVNRETREMLS